MTVKKEVEPVKAGATAHEVKKSLDSDIEKIKKSLASQPQVQFIIPLAMGEKPGAAEVVAINGYRLTVKKGTIVTVPQQIADILAEHYRIESGADQPKRLDTNPEAQQALT